jgi:heptosyltransferase-3
MRPTRPNAPSFLVVRRDNIGDLVCTTPLFSALRARYPDAWIGALVNHYNAPVLQGNPDVSAVFSYKKAKHRAKNESLLALYWRRLALTLQLRKQQIDYVILAAPGFQASAGRWARSVKPRHIVGFAGHGEGIDMPVTAPAGADQHQVEAIFRVLQPLGIDGPPPPLKLVADARLEEHFRKMLPPGGRPIVGVHISAREADRRWPDEYFKELIARITERYQATVVLTWAPGARDNALFPGDDESARMLVATTGARQIVAMPTGGLDELIASLSVCDYVISSDGGPVHLAAALGKPVLCFFGSENRHLWYPWAVDYELLQTDSKQVRDISVEAAWRAFERLREKTGIR